MFDDEARQFALYRGWMPITARACEEIDTTLGANKRNFRWTEIKEKFGGARFYYRLDRQLCVETQVDAPSPLSQPKGLQAPTNLVAADVKRIVERAEADSLRACMVCGDAAERLSYGGFVVTLCSDHQASGPDDAAWHDQVIGARLKIDDA